MRSRDEILLGISCCQQYDERCDECPYRDANGCHADELADDARELVKMEKEKRRRRRVCLIWKRR